MEQTSIANGSDKAGPYTERGWQYEVWNPAIARDEMPYEQEGERGEEDGSQTFGHVLNRETRGDREDTFIFLVGASTTLSLRSL